MGRLHPAIVAFGLLTSACGDTATENASEQTTSSNEAEDIGTVLATVNGESIGSIEFEEAAARKSPAEGDTLSAAEKQEILDKLISDKLLYTKAMQEGLDRDPKVQKVMINTLLRDVVYANVRNSDFTDEELQKYYDDHKDDFIVPEKVQIKRILIKITAERDEAAAQGEANRIRAEVVKDPGQFKELASKHSEDPYRRRGGDVGFVPKSGKPGLDQAVVDKAFSMKVDEVSDVFQTTDGFNIVLVANRRERLERTFQQMKGSVLRKVKNEKLKDLYEEYTANLKQGAEVSQDQAALDGLEIKNSAKRVGPGLALTPPGSATPTGITASGTEE